jgi:hypothetical protein
LDLQLSYSPHIALLFKNFGKNAVERRRTDTSWRTAPGRAAPGCLGVRAPARTPRASALLEATRPKAACPEGSRAPSRPASYPRHNCTATSYRGRRTRGTGGPSAAAVRCVTPAYKGLVFSFVRVHLPLSFPCHALPAPASTCQQQYCPWRRPPPVTGAPRAVRSQGQANHPNRVPGG